MRWRWRSGSAIKEGLKWLHGLWASRKRVSWVSFSVLRASAVSLDLGVWRVYVVV